MKCRECDRPATEANGLCFTDAEEQAALVFEAFMEFTGDEAQARAAAQRSWKGKAA